ncbi:MAG: AAA family ATPase [Rickettsiales bacterium]|nr:AAA family ATPase [Rickettsiales bacterium]
MPVKSDFLAFAVDDQDANVLKQFCTKHGWPEDAIRKGDIATATAYLKDNPSPRLLLVDVPSAASAQAALDGLAEVCDPDTKVIITGTINEYSFFCWLMNIGVFNYLLRPLSEQALEGAFLKSLESGTAGAKPEKAPGKLISFIGTRGGVGTTSLAINLAGIIAELSKKKVALVDLDPQEGSIALALDLEPSRGFREALEKPERMDSLFVERVMNKPHKYLSILSAEESLQERIGVHEQAADTLIQELRQSFDVVILDVPRHMSSFAKQCLAKADQVVLVTELTLLSLRDALRQADLLRESLKIKPAIVVANRVGHATKMEMNPADFEKGINTKITQKIPYAPDIYMQVGTDIPALKSKSHAAVKPLYALAELLVPEAKATDTKAKGKGLFAGKGKDSKGS